jgi:hypothetical protein
MMPNNQLDPTSILLRSDLYKIMYTSVAPTRRYNIHQQPSSRECILSHRYFLSLVSLPTESLVYNIKGRSSILLSHKLARYIGLKSELKFTFFLDYYRVALLRYYLMRRKLVILREKSQLDSLAGSIVQHVISIAYRIYGNVTNNLYIYSPSIREPTLYLITTNNTNIQI